MMIEKSMLKIPENPFNSGFFSDVYKVQLDGKTYCYKEFNKKYPNDIMSNIVGLTYEKFSEEFLTPIKMVLKEDGKDYGGYITEYKENLKTIDRTNKIELLKNARKTVSKLHIEYGIIHGDLSPSNMLFDANGKAYLIDFDSSLYANQKLGNNVSFPTAVKDYLRIYPLDYSVDAYIFNLTTLAILNNLDISCILRALSQGIAKVPENNIKVKKLSDELLLSDIRKPYSGEYIIDYL